jgi:hypothetical protein
VKVAQHPASDSEDQGAVAVDQVGESVLIAEAGEAL